MQGGEDFGWQRLDKFLFFARFCKTRVVAAGLIARGSVRINRQPTDKAHARVRPGDVLTVPLPGGVKVFQILALAERRHAAPVAQTLYREIAEG
jgi:ribosome-associated heat shock protein Hsp15